MQTNTVSIDRVFSSVEVSPYDQVKWSNRSTVITDDSGKVVFKQDNVETPESWSDMAVRIVASKYFHGKPNTDQRETSIRSLIHRVVHTISGWGLKLGYMNVQDSHVFEDELAWLCLNQYGCFNSPVWFNVGLWDEYKVAGSGGGWAYNFETGKFDKQEGAYARPQASACFTQSVDDTMESIMQLATNEAMLFKFGSGTGTNLSSIRSSKEGLSGGGMASGPLSFLSIYDRVAGSIKSGGKTRRAAKLNCLNDDHPDIEEFIRAKFMEERKAHALIEAGYDGSFNGDAYQTIMFQNENVSVRASDAFMTAAVTGMEWPLKAVTDGRTIATKDASKLLDLIAEGTWTCGDPGMQFDDTLHRWHTCKGTDRQYTTNPCAEYCFLDNTACNLASLNLVKFKSDQHIFDIDRFKAAVRLFIIAQEILVDWASYPTATIAENSYIFRTLGLGYSNLGSLIMSLGLPYDSVSARSLISSITSLMTAKAYVTSAELAGIKGSFPGYNDARCAHVSEPVLKDNVACMTDVILRHLDATKKIGANGLDMPILKPVLNEAIRCWDEAIVLGKLYGYRNAQVTVIAPAGTISFMMDCTTTGIEPDIALVKYKLLAGGGQLKIVNQCLDESLEHLGYAPGDRRSILEHVMTHDTIEDVVVNGATIKSGLKPEHLLVYDCAFKPANGSRSIEYMAHLKAMAAATPFVSGSISKTINMPNDSTPSDIRDAYVQAWRLGLKCVAIYRDGSKRSQPLSTSRNGNGSMTSTKALAEALEANAKLAEENKNLWNRLSQIGSPVRRRLPDTRKALTHKFSIGGSEGYVTVGLYDDGQPGELFIQMAKEGSTMGGLMDTVGLLTSVALQYGVPLETLAQKFVNQRFEPHGMTTNSSIPMASSIIDYIFKWMMQQFAVEGGQKFHSIDVKDILQLQLHKEAVTVTSDGGVCPSCGSSRVQRTGACSTCLNCGTSLGCS